MIEALPGGHLRLKIHYDPELNTHIDPPDSWWGTTKLTLGTGDRKDIATWVEDDVGENDGPVEFWVVPACAADDPEPEKDDAKRRYADCG